MRADNRNQPHRLGLQGPPDVPWVTPKLGRLRSRFPRPPKRNAGGPVLIPQRSPGSMSMERPVLVRADCSGLPRTIRYLSLHHKGLETRKWQPSLVPRSDIGMRGGPPNEFDDSK